MLLLYLTTRPGGAMLTSTCTTKIESTARERAQRGEKRKAIFFSG